MAERRLHNSYDGVEFLGGFDALHPYHRAYLENGIALAASVTSFEHIYIGIDSDSLLHQRKGPLSPLFSFVWRREDLESWGSTASLGDVLRIEEGTRVEQQSPNTNRLLIASSDYQDHPNFRKAVEHGVHILFAPPINNSHTSDTKNRLLKAERGSTCLERHVGAVLLRGGRAIDVGSNGGAPGSCYICPKGIDKRSRATEAERRAHSPVECTFAHAEVDALTEAQSGDDLLTTVSPCPSCAEAIVEKGINRVVYLRDWARGQPETQGTMYLKQHGVRIRQAGYHPNSPNP